MNRSIIIRPMKREDGNFVMDIYQQGIDTNIATFQTECPTYGEWDSGHLNDCRFVAELNGNIVGWIALSATSKREVYHGVVEVSIYINTNYRNQGIGLILMNRLIVESEKLGYWTLYSSVIEENKASITLHKKSGFREIGYREKIAQDRFGKWHNTILFEKRSNRN